jgi:hypothetical protein
MDDPPRLVGQRLPISLSSVYLGLSARFCAILTHRITANLDAMSVVNQSVEDTVGQGGIADLVVPP